MTKRVEDLKARTERVKAQGAQLPPDAEKSAAEADKQLAAGKLVEANAALKTWDAALATFESDFTRSLETRVEELARWAGAYPLPGDVQSALDPTWAKLKSGDLAAGSQEVEATLAKSFPQPTKKLASLVESCRALLTVAKDVGAPSDELAALLNKSTDVKVLETDRVGRALDEGRSRLEAQVRERAVAQVKAMRAVVEGLSEHGVEVKDTLANFEEILSLAANAPASQAGDLLKRSREAVEGPVVSVVAGYIDEVRPRVVEARQLGRNPQPAIDEMNRSREALRQHDYAASLKAAQHALDLASDLVSDLEAAHDEVASFKELLSRLATGGFDSAPFQSFVNRAEQAIASTRIDEMRTIIQEGLRAVGRESLPYYRNRLESQTKLLTGLEQRNWAVGPLRERINALDRPLKEGKIPETAEALAAYQAELRTIVSPLISRRLEEMGRSLEELPDAGAVETVRGLMADTDVSLKVKGNPELALESLARAEKEMAIAFAARASNVVEELDEERRALEKMGVSTEEIGREIAQVLQIFEVGDFLKGSQASQDIKSRILQQELIRAEEAVSRAKFAIVEASKMGLEPGQVKAGLSEAQEMVRSGRYPQAYALALSIREEITKVQGTAQRVLDMIAKVAELMAALRKSGVPIEELRELAPKIVEAKAAYQALSFDKAEVVAGELQRSLENIGASRDGAKQLADLQSFLAGAKLIGVAPPEWAGMIKEISELLAGNAARMATPKIKELRELMVGRVKPELDQQLTGLEGDLRAARSAGVDTTVVETALSEARRRLQEPLPVGVAETIDQARRQFFQSRAFLEQAQKAAKAARDAVNQADLVHVDTSSYRPRLEEIDRRFEDKDYPASLDLAQKLEHEATDKVRTQVAKTLANFQSMISRAKLEGALTMVAENFLVQARNLLMAGKPIEALQLATRSETELEKVELQHTLARNSLTTLQAKVEAANKDHLHCPQAAKELEQAEELFARGDYSGVLEMSMNVSDMLLQVQDTRKAARESLARGLAFLQSVTALAVDLSGPKSELSKADDLIKAGSYSEALSKARAAGEAARGAVEGVVSQSFSKAHELIDLVAQLVPDKAPSVNASLEAGQVALKARDWGTALAKLDDARNQAHEALLTVLKDQHSKLKALWKAVPAMDPSAAEARAATEASIAWALEQGEIVKAKEGLDKAGADADRLRMVYLEKEVDKLQKQVLIGEKLGVETTPIMEAFSEAKLNLQARQFEAVPQQLAKAASALNDLMATRLAEKRKEVTSELAFAKEGLNVSVQPVEEALRQAELEEESGDVGGAAVKLLEAEEELNRRKSRHRELTNLHYLLDAALTQATEHKIDVTHPRELLAESIRLKPMDYAKAIEVARTALNEVQQLLKAART